MTRWNDDSILEELIKKGRVHSINGQNVIKPPKPSKYGNVKKAIDNITFDSTGEANYYNQLKLLQRGGAIKGFKLQPQFVLQESFKHAGKTIRAITYKADFEVTDNAGHIYYVDFKSEATAKNKVYLLKKKMLLFKYPDIDFREEYN